MSSAEMITGSVMFIIAGLLLLLGILHFAKRGFLLNNAYIFASKEQRKTMDKNKYYRQSAVVFCLLSAVFALIGLSLVLHNDKITLLEIPLFAIVIIYAIASSVRDGR